jgi:hypothetical protein
MLFKLAIMNRYIDGRMPDQPVRAEREPVVVDQGDGTDEPISPDIDNIIYEMADD